MFIDSVKTSSEPQFNPGRVRLHSIESTHTCPFTCLFALCHFFVKSSHWGNSKFTIVSRSSRSNVRAQKQIVIIITVIIINIKMVLRNNYYFMDIFYFRPILFVWLSPTDIHHSIAFGLLCMSARKVVTANEWFSHHEFCPVIHHHLLLSGTKFHRLTALSAHLLISD